MHGLVSQQHDAPNPCNKLANKEIDGRTKHFYKQASASQRNWMRGWRTRDYKSDCKLGSNLHRLEDAAIPTFLHALSTGPMDTPKPPVPLEPSVPEGEALLCELEALLDTFTISLHSGFYCLTAEWQTIAVSTDAATLKTFIFNTFLRKPRVND